MYKVIVSYGDNGVETCRFTLTYGNRKAMLNAVKCIAESYTGAYDSVTITVKKDQ